MEDSHGSADLNISLSISLSLTVCSDTSVFLALSLPPSLLLPSQISSRISSSVVTFLLSTWTLSSGVSYPARGTEYQREIFTLPLSTVNRLREREVMGKEKSLFLSRSLSLSHSTSPLYYYSISPSLSILSPSQSTMNTSTSTTMVSLYIHCT